MKVEQTIYLPEPLRTRLKVEAARSSRTISEVAEAAIVSELARTSAKPKRVRNKGRK